MTDSNRCTADLDRSSLSGWSGSHRAFDGNLGVAVNTCKSPVVGTTSALGLAWGAVPRGNGSSAAWAAAPCTCRIAFGPRAGQKVFFTVQGAMPRDAARDQDLCADHLRDVLTRSEYAAAERYFSVYAMVSTDQAVVTAAHRTRRRRLH